MCEISKQDLTAKWKKGDVSIGGGDKYQMVSEGGVHKLIINDVESDDDSEYTVVFRDVETTAKLFVKGKEAY